MINVRLPLMLLAFVNLLAGITAGLIRIGWNFSMGALPVQHGAVMVGGFLGSLILLEKVIPLKRKVLFIIPVVNALSLVMIIPAFSHIGQAFLTIGALGLLYVVILYFMAVETRYHFNCHKKKRRHKIFRIWVIRRVALRWYSRGSFLSPYLTCP